MITAPGYTAAEIALAIGWTKRRIATALEAVLPNGVKVVSGNEARTWSASVLPESVSREIQRLRQVHRFRTADDLLQNPAKRWQPAVAITQVCDADIRRASQLKDALARALQLDEQTSIAERARVALPDYRRVFGREITDRQLRSLITRTLDRDRGTREFARLEIYLAETIRPKRSSLPEVQFPALEDNFATLLDRSNPTAAERSFCWRKIIRTYAEMIEAGANATVVKRAVCDFVFAQLPALARSAQAVKRNFERKLSEANHSGLTALIDRRATKSGLRSDMELWRPDIEKLQRHARHETGGRIAQAFRELHSATTATGEQFSAEFREQFRLNVRDAKSYVPNAVRAAVRSVLKATDALHLGPKAARVSGPSYRRDWSGVFAGDSYSADDFTFNHPFIAWHENGEFVYEGRRFSLTRGQTLVFCDERSLRIHGYYLTPHPNYGAGTICAGINRICMDETIGLPFRRFLFERGAWKARAVKSAVDWSRIDQMFLQEGVEFRGRIPGDGLPRIVHATTPKAKIIERIGGQIQNLMQGAPGYTGRNQRLDGPERTAKAIAQLRRIDQRCKQEIDPQKFFLTKDQFCRELEDASRRFNAEPQNGKMLDGRSPEEAWKELHPQDGRPHKLLPESLRYLLATQVTEVTVTEEGITLKRRGKPLYYCGSERLGKLIGEKVRVRFNEETPEFVSVCHLRCDPKELQPFTVEIDPSIPAVGATHADFQRARGARQAFRQPGRDVYRVIAPRSNLTLLDANTGSENARHSGEALLAAKREHEALRSARRRAGSKAADIAKRHNVRINPSTLQPERALHRAENLDTLEQRIRQREAEGQ